MSWIPPFFTCGICGGEIGRWPLTNPSSVEKAVQVDLGRITYAWRHRTVGEDWKDTPHQAVLGTQAHKPVMPPAKQRAADHIPVPPDVAPPPVVPARPAEPHEIPASAASFIEKARANGWRVGSWYMQGPLMDAQWHFKQMVESVVVKAVRDGHMVVGIWWCRSPGAPRWTAKDWPGPPYVTSFNPWKFDEAYTVGHEVDPLTSPELNAAVVVPRAVCESCGEPPALHVSTPTGPVCHNEWTAQQKEA